MFCVFGICLLCVTLAEAIGFKVNGDVLQIESDSQGQLYPHRTDTKYDGVYRKSLKVDSFFRLSDDNQHKKRFLMAGSLSFVVHNVYLPFIMLNSLSKPTQHTQNTIEASHTTHHVALAKVLNNEWLLLLLVSYVSSVKRCLHTVSIC